jgi:oligopeptide/dipeptide ABC transporter ATP-binding protein
MHAELSHDSDVILEGLEVTRNFKTSAGAEVEALRRVDVLVRENEIVGVLGESGSGKTTLGRCLIGAIPVSSGAILVHGRPIRERKGMELRRTRKTLQMVFQNPSTSLNPSMKVGATIEEPLRLWSDLSGHDRRRRVTELLANVELGARLVERKSRELSGGQQQRVALARALACDPEMIVLDEPTSALDVTTEIAIFKLLHAIRSERRLSYLLISHDVLQVAEFADRVLVMYAGQVVEEGEVATVLGHPEHPYTRALIHASDDNDSSPPDWMLLDSLEQPPTVGCPLRPRCPVRQDGCESHERLVPMKDGRRVRCIRAVSSPNGETKNSKVSGEGQP